MNISKALVRLFHLTTTLGVAARASTSAAQNFSIPVPVPVPSDQLGLQSPLQQQQQQQQAGIMPRAPVVSISHGGGPMPVLGDPMHAEIVRSLRTRVPKILKLGTPDAPRAIVVVTAHWQADRPSISAASSHKLLYDYGGFPPEAYKLKYEAPGSPDVAAEVRDLLKAEGFDPSMDTKRGWDHGVFIPFLLINPAADVPIVQLSILQSEDADEHLRMGRALQALRDRNVAIVGSGFASLHNFAIMRPVIMGTLSGSAMKGKFDAWNAALTDAVLREEAADRAARLTKWRALPHAYDMHPDGGADHFMPLLVCGGAAGDGKGQGYKDDFGGIPIWSFYWE